MSRRLILSYVERYLRPEQTFVYRQMTTLPRSDHAFAARYRVPDSPYPDDSVHFFGDAEPARGWFRTKLRRIRQRVQRRYTWLSTGEEQRLRDLFRERRPQVVHAHWAPDAMQVIGASEEADVPLLVAFYGYDVSWLTTDPVYRMQLTRLFRQMKLGITVSENMRARIIAMGCPPERVVTHYTGVPADYFLPRRDPAEARRRPFVLVQVGRFVPVKGHRLAVEALARAKRHVPDLLLRLVGDGRLRADIEAQVEREGLRGQVEFLGWQDPAGVVQQLRQGHALILPSVAMHGGDIEGIPNVVVEAMAAGLPVISSLHGGTPEVARYSDPGWLVAEGDVAGLADRIVALATDPQRWLRMSVESQELAREGFHLPTQNALLEKIYDRLIG